MKTPTFKKGQWLISRWHDGNVDFCLFGEDVDGIEFYDNEFIRIHNGEIKYKFKEPNEINSYTMHGKSLQWRPATKAELKKYSELIFS